MSQDNRKKRKKFRLDSRFWARVLVIILVGTMLLGTFYYFLVFLMIGKRSAYRAMPSCSISTVCEEPMVLSDHSDDC